MHASLESHRPTTPIRAPGRLLGTAAAHPFAPWALFALAIAVGLAGAPAPTAWARLFFVLVIGSAIVAAARLIGLTAQLLIALSLVALVAGQRAIDRPFTDPPSSQWTAPLRAPDQQIQHLIALPTGRPSWTRLWQRAAGAAAYVCARGPLGEEDGLQLFVNDEMVATITQAHAIGPRPQPTSVGFYRLPVGRELLERQQPAKFSLRRAAGATSRDIEVCGTFSYRPTAGIESSSRFDGSTWSSPGKTMHGRFLIELRIEDARGRAIEALY
ncbi:MAG: hypothetical protein HY332_21075 [Chloroflexi bacterium]|nr:hypothetical protein [Chloroflexota bacterium]